MQPSSLPFPDSPAQPLLFNDLGPRRVEADFSAGHLSSDGGLLLLRQIDEGLGISRTLASCFHDHRDPRFTEHSLRELLAQRLLGVAAGYEDLNDHDRLRLDPLFAVCAGKADPLGMNRAERDQGKALASPSTLNRLELGNNKHTRCHKIHADPEQIEASLLLMGVRCLPKHTPEVVIDLDASDDPLHGQQEGRFYHGYYGNYCYLPLFAFVGNVPLWAQLRTSDGDAARGSVEALAQSTAGISGEVLVDFIVDTNGDVRNAFAAHSSQREFEATAVQAVTKWKFRPGRKNGHAVFTHMQVPIVFTLNEDN